MRFDAIAGKHQSLREGARLGLVVAAVIWIWIAVIDAISGEPFRTFDVLGGIIPFTLAHIVLNVAYGVVIVSTLRGAARAPSLVIGLTVGFVMLEIAFAMVTVFLSETTLGQLAWLRILGGSLVGAAVAVAIVSRKYPILTLLRRAEHEQ